MPKYQTKQRRILVEYLSAHHDDLLSAEQIADDLAGEGISKSAVYRNLSALESEGRLRRSGKPGERSAYYQYSDAEECRERLHLSCRECGKTCHLEDETAKRLEQSLADDDGFLLDRSETVLYGVCRECASANKKKNTI